MFFLLLSQYTFTQQKSEPYLSIKTSKNISNFIKEKKIDSIIVAIENKNRDTLLAHSLYDYGRWLYRNSSTEKALIYTIKSVRVFEDLEYFDEIIYKKTLNNVGFLYGKLGDYFKAYKAYQKLSRYGKKDKYMAGALRNCGLYLARLGDFYKASEYFENAIILANELKDPMSIYNCSVSASINYKHIESKSSFSRGIEIMNNLIIAIENINTGFAGKIGSKNILRAYNHLANLYNDRDDFNFEKSKKNYDKALDIALNLKDSLSIAYLYSDLGYLYLHEGRKETIAFLNKALKYKPANTATSIIYGNKSAYFLTINNLEQALYNAQLSINELSQVSLINLKSLPTKESITASKNKYEVLESLIEKAKVWISFHMQYPSEITYLKNALKTLKQADYLVDLIRLESSDQKSKLFWREIASQVYGNAVDVCFNLDKAEEAFYYMEKNKAILLLEDVSMRLQIENVKIPEKVTNRQNYLKNKIIVLNRALNNQLTSKDSIRSILLRTKDNYNDFLDSIANNFNIYYKTQKPPSIISLENARKTVIQENEVFIEYILNETRGYGLLFTKDKVQLFQLQDVKKLKGLSMNYKIFLQNPLKNKEERNDYQKVSHELYNMLIPKKIAPFIRGKKIRIIADSYLQNIPFEALQTSLEPHNYFIKSHDISYAYSISFLEQNRHIKRKNSTTFLGFAPVDFKAMTSLTRSKEEVDFGASQFSSATFFFKKATKKNFIENSMGSSIIHLASHSNASDTENPWIAFNDEKLTLDELYLTKNTAELVVLSACETSLGELNKGEGVMSLSRGFFNTGANSVLSTLWKVNDKSSSEIIIDFYKQLKKGKSKSEALRTAKLNYFNTHELSELSPYYWSSLVLIGDANSMSLHNNTLTYILLLVILICSISFYFYKKRKTQDL